MSATELTFRPHYDRAWINQIGGMQRGLYYLRDDVPAERLFLLVARTAIHLRYSCSASGRLSSPCSPDERMNTVVARRLDEAGVKYVLKPHTRPIFTTEDVAREPGVRLTQSAKTMLLRGSDGQIVVDDRSFALHEREANGGAIRHLDIFAIPLQESEPAYS